jgi:hypothetical protein
MKIPRSAVIAVVEAVDMGFRSATKYLDPHTVVRCTNVREPDARYKSVNYVLKMGRPNYAERKFIKDCLTAGEKFPVRKVQLRGWPSKNR